jgi:tRNA modification GTPase
VIEVHLDLDGYPVTLLDTAGIRDSEDPVEQEGVRRARARASEADLVLWVEEATEGTDRSAAPDSQRPLENTATWIVRNKADLLSGQRNELINEKINDESVIVLISAETGFGLAHLLSRISQFAKSYFGQESAILTRERHKNALMSVKIGLDRALGSGGSSADEIVAEDLRVAARALGRLTGRVDVEDLLDVIFRDFCIGK